MTADGSLAIVTLGVGVFATLVAIRRLGGLVNPAAVFLAAWTTSLALYALRLLPYPALGPETVALIGGSAFAFVGGVWLGGHGAWRDTAADAGRWFRHLHDLMDRRVVSLLLVGLLILGLTATTLYVVAVARELGILAFALDLASVRVARGHLRYPGALTWGAALYIWLLAAGAGSAYRLPRWTYVLAVTALIPFTLTTGRTELFFVAISGVVGFLLRQGERPRVTPRQVLAVGGIGVFLLAAFLGLSELMMKSGRYLALDLGFPAPLASLADPYIYASGAIPALDWLVHDVARALDLTGPLSFWPAHRALYALDLGLPPADWVSAFIEIPFRFNTYTFLEPYLREYGFAGCFLATFLLGLAGGWLHRVALVGACPPARIPYAILAFAIALSPMVNHFSQLVVPMLIVIVTVLTWTAATASRLVRDRGAS
jgi:oligosaccharide repeat unit polymerase